MRNTLLMILACLLIGCATKPNKLENECVYTPEKTTFTFWSSVAEKMEVRLYNTYDASEFEVITLHEQEGDFWTATIKGDQVGKFYTVCSYQGGEWGQESPGIFAKAVSVNGQKAAIIDMQATDPEGWENDQRPAMADPTDGV